ncbi:hypothetical protein CDAR_538781 [Caerostris darwini]|uniref:Uncharacterized protein n=1 Tax=Caerostris darwini TaxID=1538125 RepID=A0AAV4T299_9ARAC|nr:hypothetical protein CDAR_538781 [Caerostris darwini]
MCCPPGCSGHKGVLDCKESQITLSEAKEAIFTEDSVCIDVNGMINTLSNSNEQSLAFTAQNEKTSIDRTGRFLRSITGFVSQASRQSANCFH